MPSDLRAGRAELYFDTKIQREPSGIVNLTVEPRPRATGHLDEPRPPARWKTPEFIAYAIAFVIVVPIMVWIPVRLSSPAHPNFPLYAHRLSPGWIFGRPVDNSDHQYRGFRNNIPVLTVLAGLFFLLKEIYSRSTLRWVQPRDETHLYLVPFIVAFATLMLVGLHGSSAIKIYLILSINFAIAKYFKGSKLNPILTWVFNMGVLIANEKNGGHRFGDLHTSLEFLDSLNGVDPRWHIRFNITMLRLVAFNMDYFWTCNNVGSTDTGSPISEKQRPLTLHPSVMFSFQNYAAYVLYPPLFIAGPIITFNDFMWQLRRPILISIRAKILYFIRFVACLLTMEVLLHYMYVIAIKDTSAWTGDSPSELSMIGFWNLIIVWLKLLIPWRFFRLWALVDGISPPENMIRCMANNYSALGFWKSWHRSYNLWNVRYIYIPLGGSKNAILTTILVFSFVALWHDLTFRLLAWGWLVSLFILPELGARYLFTADKYGKKPWYRHVCAMGGVFNIMMMMSANLVGFVLGTDGMSYMLEQLTGSWDGIRFLMMACTCLFIAVQVMFEYREEEMRQGIFRGC